MEDTNTQTQSVPAATGPNVADIQAELERVKKESEGRLRDLQAERNKRQELEQRVSSPAPSAEQTDDTELHKVLKPVIDKQTHDIRQELEAMRLEKAQQYLVGKTGKTWAQIEADRDFQDRLNGVIRKYGVTGNIIEATQRAYELMQLEDLKAKQEEQARAAQASQAQSLPSGTGSVTSSVAKVYTAADFNSLSGREFGELEKKGSFRKRDDGQFEYTPRS